MFKKTVYILTMIAVLLAGCGAQAPSAMPIERSKAESAPAAPEDLPQSDVSGNPVGGAPAAERLVIQNVSLAMAVDDPAKSSERIGAMAEEVGGFVVSANVYQTSLRGGATVLQASITIRVPSEKLDEALARIKTETTQPVIRENITSEDVTAAYTDLQSRLRNAEAVEAELTRFLDTAQDTDDVLNIYAQLKLVREEIEILKGQIQYYEQSAALSAISVELAANEAVQPISVGGWQLVGIAKDAIEALVSALKVIGSGAIWFTLFCAPLLLLAGIPLGIVVALVRRQARKTRKTLLPPTSLPPQ